MRTSPFRMGPQLSPTLCFPKGLSERSYLLKSTSVTNHSNDIITHMSLLMRISNFLNYNSNFLTILSNESRTRYSNNI